MSSNKIGCNHDDVVLCRYSLSKVVYYAYKFHLYLKFKCSDTMALTCLFDMRLLLLCGWGKRFKDWIYNDSRIYVPKIKVIIINTETLLHNCLFLESDIFYIDYAITFHYRDKIVTNTANKYRNHDNHDQTWKRLLSYRKSLSVDVIFSSKLEM